MAVAVRVQGGTNAGTRTVRHRPAWIHLCDTATVRHPADGWHGAGYALRLPGSRYSCPYCGTRRPA